MGALIASLVFGRPAQTLTTRHILIRKDDDPHTACVSVRTLAPILLSTKAATVFPPNPAVTQLLVRQKEEWTEIKM